MPAASYHLTIRHFGPVGPRRERAIRRRAAEAAGEALPTGITIDRAGLFGTPWRPRVLWAGAASTPGRLEALAGLVAAAFPDGKAPLWVPHVTIARFPRAVDRGDRERWRTTLEEVAAGGRQVGPVRCKFRDLVLFESVRVGGPVRYEARASWRLGG